jgi:hypothetical protein
VRLSLFHSTAVLLYNKSMLYNVFMGRKPEGLGRQGEPKKIRDYPKLLVTIRPSVKTKLKRISARENLPMWKIIEAAIQLYEQTKAKKQRRRSQ